MFTTKATTDYYNFWITQISCYFWLKYTINEMIEQQRSWSSLYRLNINNDILETVIVYSWTTKEVLQVGIFVKWGANVIMLLPLCSSYPACYCPGSSSSSLWWLLLNLYQNLLKGHHPLHDNLRWVRITYVIDKTLFTSDLRWPFCASEKLDPLLYCLLEPCSFKSTRPC